MITDGIAHVTPNSIITADGVERPVDAIVLATGFHVIDWYTFVDIKGARGEDLVDRWNREGVVAHRGIMAADLPNLFFLLGPNTGLGHNSVVFMIESQIHYVAAAIAAVDKAGVQALSPTRAAQDRVQRQTAARPGEHRMEHRRLPQLVSGRARRQPIAVVGTGVGILVGDAVFRAGGVHAEWLEKTSRDTTSCVAV